MFHEGAFLIIMLMLGILSLVILYWVIRLAVLHALEDYGHATQGSPTPSPSIDQPE